MACPQAQHRHLGRGLGRPSDCRVPVLQTHAPPPGGLAPRLPVTPPPRHAALSLVVPTAALPHCPHQNVTVLWPSQLLPSLLCNRITHALSTSVIMSLRSHDCTSLEFGT